MGVSGYAHLIVGLKINNIDLLENKPVRCCSHPEHDSKFCPECGKPMWKDNLEPFECVADIEDAGNGDVTVVAEDIIANKKYKHTVDMVVLATGMQPTMSDEEVPFGAKKDKYGFFIDNDDTDNGMFFVGCCHTPSDVSSNIKEANSVALKAIQCIERK